MTLPDEEPVRTLSMSRVHNLRFQPKPKTKKLKEIFRSFETNLNTFNFLFRGFLCFCQQISTLKNLKDDMTKKKQIN
jgi:hypothetical protein